MVGDLYSVHSEITLAVHKRKGALHAACYAGNEERALMLIAQGADVNYLSKANRQTALHQCCIRGLLAAALELVRKGARLDVRDYYNRTALECARDLGHPAMVAPLLAAAGSSVSVSKKKKYQVGDSQLDYARQPPRPLVERSGSCPLAWDKDLPRQAVSQGWLRGRFAPQHSMSMASRRVDARFSTTEWTATGGHRIVIVDAEASK